jgi:uncharacterized protein YecA (UPF0149 family)
MMDLCRCQVPKVVTKDGGDYCTACGLWYIKAEWEKDPRRLPPEKLGRNDPCHCGSGKKFKKCCLNKGQT